MKKLLSITAVFIILLTSCSSPVKIQKFEVFKDQISEGEEVSLSWQVENAEYIKILGQNNQPVYNGTMGTFSIIDLPMSTVTYAFIAGNSNGEDTSYAVVNVIKAPEPVAAKPKVKEEINQTKEKYLSGIIHEENVTEKNKFTFEIFGFDRSKYPDDINIYMIVKDENGNFVANLAPPFGDIETQNKYFKEIKQEIEEREFQVDKFEVTEVHDEYLKTNAFGLVLDHSGSMFNHINELQQSAKKFLYSKKSVDEISIVKFDTDVNIEVPLSNDLNYINRYYLMNGLEGYGWATSLFAGCDVGLRSISGSKFDKNLIVFTDGQENSSILYSYFKDNTISFKPLQIIYKAREMNAKIYTIGFGMADRVTLEKMSILTDGKFFWAENGKEISKIYSALPRMFQNYYKISYKPKKINGYHNVSVKGMNPDGSITETKGSTYIGENLKIPDLPEDYPQAIAWFKFGSTNVEDSVANISVFLSNFLKSHPHSIVELHGHADSRGNEKRNVQLSLLRANKFKKMLINNGVNPKNIKTIGHGSSKRIWNDDTNEFAAHENRRVEIIIKDR